MSQHRARHRAERPARRPARRLLATTALAAVVVAGTGAAVAHHSPTGGERAAVAADAQEQVRLSARDSSTGTDAVGWTLGSRERAVSRDSERQALSDAVGAKVQPATEEKGSESNAALKSLARATEEKANTMALDSWVLPVATYTLTARFGQAGGRWVNNHTGLDFAAPTGTPIVAVAGGTITQTGWGGAYGNRTVETLEDGTELWYCHQSAIQVKPGQQVTSGQRIGLVGATGNVTGPHLHLEVRPGGGDPVDPFQALVHHGLKP